MSLLGVPSFELFPDQGMLCFNVSGATSPRSPNFRQSSRDQAGLNQIFGLLLAFVFSLLHQAWIPTCIFIIMQGAGP